MDFASCCFNGDSFFIFLPDLSLVNILKNGSRLKKKKKGEKIRDSTANNTVNYFNFLLHKKNKKKLRIVF